MRKLSVSSRDEQWGGRWRKSSYSGGNDDCVEMALLGEGVAVRDSKNPSLTPACLSMAAWSEFIGAVREGGMG